MSNYRFLLLSFIAVLAVSQAPFTDYALTCTAIPQNGSFNENLSFLWGKAFMGEVDRYVFLIMCPLLIIAELITLVFYHSNPKILGQPGILYCVVIGFELLLNIHYLASAAYFTYTLSEKNMPNSYLGYCTANSILVTFFQTLHFVFLLMVPLYIVFILRRTLKSNNKIWTLVYIIVFLIACGSTYFMWEEEFLGLNIYGLCSLTFIRAPNQSAIIPILPIISNAIFVIAGLFTIQYYNKHMPNTVGLRKKKHVQKQLLLIYVFGYSLFWLVDSITDMLLYFRCQNDTISSNFSPVISIRNTLNIFECFLIFVIVYRTESVRKAFKKFMRKIVSKKQSESQLRKLNSLSVDENDIPREDFNFEEVFLEIKVEKNDIDVLKISQVVTLVSGIYIAYKQYYNIQDHQYFNPHLASVQNMRLLMKEEGRRKKHNFRTTKKIYFHQKMSIKLDDEITKDFIIDLSLLPKLGILECTMIIHAPKVFQIMLQSDNLAEIFSSFELRENTKKMFDIVEGQGGRSGQFFFFSKDNKYVLKTITQLQFQFIDSNLFYFYQHFVRNPHSVLAKIYGLFTFHGNEIQRTYHMILMKNILACQKEQIIRTYDMKGSKDNRQVNKEGDIQVNELKKVTLKDVDFLKEEGRLHIDNHKKLKLREIIMKDTNFLKSLNLLDYSLLVVRVRWDKPPENVDFWGDYQRIRSEENQKEYYHIGIIDYLQRWDLQKIGEKWWKKLIGKKDVSAQEPGYYQQRFISFITDITRLIPNFQDSPVQSRKQSQLNSSIKRHSSTVTINKTFFRDISSSQEQCLKKNEENLSLSERREKKRESSASRMQEESNESSNYKKDEMRIVEIEMQRNPQGVEYQLEEITNEYPQSQIFEKQLEEKNLEECKAHMRSDFQIYE